jgi:hypothetical protein
MYLPLTGQKDDKEKSQQKMSIDSINTTPASQFVKPADSAAKPQQEQDTSVAEVKKQQDREQEAVKTNQQAIDGFYDANSMNTQDFLILKSQSNNEQFKVLDEVIANMKEDVEQLGDAMDAMAEMAEKTSKANLGLQIIEKTLEAMEEAKGER